MRRHKSEGFTLIEIMVSISFFLIIASFIAQSIAGYLKMNLNFETRGEAIQAAQQILDEYRIQDPTTLPSGGSSQAANVIIGSRTYLVTTVFCPAGFGYCASGNIRHLQTTVTRSGNTLYAVDTLFSQLR